MRITVYVPCHNNEKTLPDVLAALKNQTKPAYEYLFVNDRCTDESPAIARQFGFEVLTLDGSFGLSAGRNRALQRATGDILQGVDADVAIEPEYLAKLEHCFHSRPSVAAISGRADERYTDTPPDFWRSLHMWQHHGDRELFDPNYLVGSTFACRVEAARQIGGWNERFITNYEDVDLGHRLRAADFHLLYNPDLRASHLRRDTVESVLRGRWNWERPGWELCGHYHSTKRWLETGLPTIWMMYRGFRAQELQLPALWLVTLLMPWTWLIRDLYMVRQAGDDPGEIWDLVGVAGDALTQCGAQRNTVQAVTHALAELVHSLDGRPARHPPLNWEVLSAVRRCACESLPPAHYWSHCAAASSGAISNSARKWPNAVAGLKYLPTLGPAKDDLDEPFYWPPVASEFSAGNQIALRDAFLAIRDACRCIVEIGVYRNGTNSSTHVLLQHKTHECVYLGVDLDDKSFLDDPAVGIFTVRCNSAEISRVMSRLKELQREKIDLLLIDGWHSVNQVISDWQYTEFLSERGVVVMHDTNRHPGPVMVFDAIDERLFEKTKFCQTDTDWGIAVIRRRFSPPGSADETPNIAPYSCED